MNKQNWAIKKLVLLLFLSIFLVIIYCVSVPNEEVYYKSYTFNFISVLYTFIILCSVLIIDFKQLTKQNWLTAFCLGLLSIGVTIPIIYIGILSSICTSTAYLVSISMSNSYEEKIDLFPQGGFQELVKDIIIILLTLIILIILSWSKIKAAQNISIFKFSFIPIFKALGASISEEVIFIMFLYSIMLKVNNGEELPILLTLAVITLPFSIIHTIEQIIQTGFFSAIPKIITFCYWNIVSILLAKKRSLFAAIGVHFVNDWIAFALLNKY